MEIVNIFIFYVNKNNKYYKLIDLKNLYVLFVNII